MKKILRTLFVLSVAILCNPSFAADATPKDGWIKKVVLGSELKDKAVRECVAQMPPEQVDAHRFVVIAYPKGRGLAYKTIPVAQESDLKPGDSVSFDLVDCSVPVTKH